MELQVPNPFGLAAAADSAEASALTELEAAIALVESGVATRVRIAGLAARVADRVGGIGAARAGCAGLGFRAERSDERVTFTVGPRD